MDLWTWELQTETLSYRRVGFAGVGTVIRA